MHRQSGCLNCIKKESLAEFKGIDAQGNIGQAELAGYRVNAFQLLRQVFHHYGIVKRVTADRGPKADEYGELEVFEYQEDYPTSAMGTPILDTILFNPGQEDEFFLEDSPLIRYTLSKKEKLSQIRSKKSAVIEETIINNIRFSIQGLIVNRDSYDPPYDRIKAFKELVNTEGSREVESDLFNALGVDMLYLKEARFFTDPGFSNVEFFEITALSDCEHELEIP